MPEKNYFHIKYQQTELYYQKFGTGQKTLLAFHGYGQESTAISAIAAALSDQYTTYSFDLFFHGKSQWPFQERPLEKDYWQQLIQHFLTTYKIENFSLLGYSMGAKFVLAILEFNPKKVDTMLLIAPDGIKTNGWYSLATYPLFLRRIFKLTIKQPALLLKLMKLLHWLKLLDKGLMKFASLEMNTLEKRKRVYYSWVVFRHLSFDIPKIVTLINNHNIPVIIFLGKFDKVITKANMFNLISRLNPYELIELECGHNNLLNRVAKTYDHKTQSFLADNEGIS